MKIKISGISICLVVAVCLIMDMNFQKWKQQEGVIENDIHMYYGYLPALFIYQDIKLEKSNYLVDGNYYFWTVKTPDGKSVIKMTMGLAYLYAPFFFTAHGYAKLFNYPATGFSEPYKISLLLGTLVYLLIGLLVVRKILAHYKFSDLQISISLLLTGLGTNIVCYSTLGAPMPHVFNFCLFALFLYFSIKWHEKQSIKNTILLGLIYGIITLIRPSNAVLIIVFIFFDANSFKSIKDKIVLICKKPFLPVLFCFLILLVWLPQLLYWKEVTGSYFIYSYPNEAFFFNHPHIIDGLFSFRKGWLTYTPIMSFALLGFLFMNDELKQIRFSLLLFLIPNLYIIFSWWCWWYGGTMGQRALIDSYALMAVPLASFIKFLSKSSVVYRILFFCMALFFVWLNVFQTFQLFNDSLHYDAMTSELYFKQFGKLTKITDFYKYLNPPNYYEAAKGNDCDDNSHMKIINDNNHIELLASNANFLSAEKSDGSVITANQPFAGKKEIFIISFLPDRRVSFQAFDRHFLCAELRRQNEITYTRDNTGSWESFELVKLDNNSIALKAANGNYLSIDEKSMQLFARAKSIGKNETFILIHTNVSFP